MAPRTGTATTTKRRVLERHRRTLDRLSTREAQVLRMRYGVTEPPEAAVGVPAPGVARVTREALETVEQQVVERLQPEPPDDTKRKIVKVLKKRH